jgi:hypothetical protein
MYFYLAMVLTMSLSRLFRSVYLYVIALLLLMTHASLYSASASTYMISLYTVLVQCTVQYISLSNVKCTVPWSGKVTVHHVPLLISNLLLTLSLPTVPIFIVHRLTRGTFIVITLCL